MICTFKFEGDVSLTSPFKFEGDTSPASHIYFGSLELFTVVGICNQNLSERKFSTY